MGNRFKSKVAWASFVSLLILVFQVFGIHKKLGIELNDAAAILNGVLVVLVAFGILNNPTDRGEF